MATESANKTMPVTATLIELEIPIEASRERVWNALVDDTGEWWPKDFYVTADPRPITLEAKAGGRLFERGSEGATLLKVSDAIFGQIGENLKSIKDGWHVIFHDNFKKFVERKT